jgi:hypothetical protein
VLFHQPQLHEHGRPPSDLWARTTTAKKVATGEWWTLLRARGVVQVPEPLSPRYRSRVREVSGRYRSHGIHYVPGPHTATSLLGTSCAGCNANPRNRRGPPERASDLLFCGADDGIRTRDPNLGKAIGSSARVRWNRISPGHSVLTFGGVRLNRYIPAQWM